MNPHVRWHVPELAKGVVSRDHALRKLRDVPPVPPWAENMHLTLSRIVSALPFVLLLLSPLSAAAQSPDGLEGKSVSQWTAELNAEEFRDQWHAAYVLGVVGSQAAPAVPALHAVLDVKSGKNEYARSMAAWALGRIGPAAEPEIPFLFETMRTTKLLAVRRSTAEALGNFGPAARSAAGDLVKMLDNEDDVTRVNAAVALWKIDRDAKAVPALVEMLRQGDPSQTYAAAVALGQMGGGRGGRPGPDRGPARTQRRRSPGRRPVLGAVGQGGVSGAEEGQCPAGSGRRHPPPGHRGPELDGAGRRAGLDGRVERRKSRGSPRGRPRWATWARRRNRPAPRWRPPPAIRRKTFAPPRERRCSGFAASDRLSPGMYDREPPPLFRRDSEETAHGPHAAYQGDS